MGKLSQLVDKLIGSPLAMAAVKSCPSCASLRAEVERLERVSERLDKKLAEEYLKTMASNARIKQLEDAVEWALGEGESDFRPRAEGEGPYWWRNELRRRAGMEGK